MLWVTITAAIPSLFMPPVVPGCGDSIGNGPAPYLRGKGIRKTLTFIVTIAIPTESTAPSLKHVYGATVNQRRRSRTVPKG